MKYVIANWKMNMGSKEILEWSGAFSKRYKNIKKDWKKRKIIEERWPRVIICPSLIYVPAMCDIAGKMGVSVGTQDVSSFDKGAHTGDIGAFQIKDFCKYAIIGHSERQENIEDVIKKRDLCLRDKITPIICFVNPANLISLYKDGCIIAWENPQNISVGGVYRSEEPEKIEAIAKEIRKIIPTETPLIYGGSVNEKNASQISRIREIDGVLVGNASLDSETFTDIIRYYVQD